MSTTDESATVETPAQALFGNRFLTKPAPARHFPERQQVKQESGQE